MSYCRKGQEAKVLDKRVYKGTSPTSHDFGPPGCLRYVNQNNYEIRGQHFCLVNVGIENLSTYDSDLWFDLIPIKCPVMVIPYRDN